MPQTSLWSREQQFWVGLRSWSGQYISVNVIWYYYIYPKELILFQNKPNISSGTGGVLCFEEERTVGETLSSVRQKRLERKTGEREEISRHKRHHTTASLMALPHSPIYPGDSHHILTPLLFEERCLIGLLVSYSFCWIQDRKSLPSWTAAYGCVLATHYQVTIIHLVKTSSAGKSSGSN